MPPSVTAFVRRPTSRISGEIDYSFAKSKPWMDGATATRASLGSAQNVFDLGTGITRSSDGLRPPCKPPSLRTTLTSSSVAMMGSVAVMKITMNLLVKIYLALEHFSLFTKPFLSLEK